MKSHFKTSLASWLTLTRIGAAARGVLPFFLGTVIAWSQGFAISLPVFFLSSFAVLIILVATFLINDYYDYGTDLLNKNPHRLSGGSRVLTVGLMPVKRALYAAYSFFALAAAIGFILYFYYHTGFLTLPLGALAMLIGYFYTAKPVRLSYRSLGELSILFTCGWLATTLGYYLQTGIISSMVSWVSVPGAISVFLLILINEVPDMASDALSGKRNLAVILGKRNALVFYGVGMIVCWLTMLVILPVGVPRITALLSLTLLPVIGLNLLDIRKNPAESKMLEKLSVRTMLIDHMVTLIYTVAFIINGINAGRMNGAIVIIWLCYPVIFALEGTSLMLASRLPEQKAARRLTDVI